MSFYLFVTASEAEHKAINRLLLYLRDWEDENGDDFKLVTSKTTERMIQDPSELGNDKSKVVPIAAATSAPVDPDLINEWAGASITDVEKFCNKTQDAGLWVILDAEGLRDQTCILAEYVTEEKDEGDMTVTEEFNKARVPWHQVRLICCNLEIANVGWDEYMEEDSEDPEGKWWTLSDEDTDDHQAVRDKEIEKLQLEGRA